MSFKKLPEEVKVALAKVKLTSLDGFAKQIFSSIKAGGNFFLSGPKGTGKTTAAFISTFHKVHKEYEGSPRALFICSTIDEAVRIYDLMVQVCRSLDITVDLAHDKGNIQQQRNDIFDGTEIIVGTPKRIYELYIQNGINFNLLELFICDDLDEVLLDGKQMELKRMLESLDKCQLMFLSNTYNKRVQQFQDSIETPSRVVEWEE